MKNMIILLLLLSMLTGCAATGTIDRLNSQTGTGFFRVVEQGEGSPVAGFGDLHVSLTVKTRKAGTVVFDTSSRGTERYQMLIGVGEQTMRVTGQMTVEEGNYLTSKAPEVGAGMRYRFDATLRLPVGSHLVTVALPGEEVAQAQAVEIRPGDNRLKLKPVYRLRNMHRRIGFTGERTYYEGVKSLEPIKQDG